MTKKTTKVNNKAKWARITEKGFKKALEGSFGNLTIISQRMGKDRSAVHKWLEKNDYLKPLLEQEREKLLDRAENNVAMKIINEKDQRATEFYLRTQGRKRGYVEKVEQEVKADTTVHFDEAVITAWKKREDDNAN